MNREELANLIEFGEDDGVRFSIGDKVITQYYMNSPKTVKEKYTGKIVRLYPNVDIALVEFPDGMKNQILFKDLVKLGRKTLANSDIVYEAMKSVKGLVDKGSDINSAIDTVSNSFGLSVEDRRVLEERFSD